MNNNFSHYDLTRDEWVNCAKEIMTSLVTSGESGKKRPPLMFQRSDAKVSYPKAFDPAYKTKEATFECLSRSFFLAAILICNEPSICINGINLKDYYKSWILNSCSADSKLYIGDYKSMCLQKKKQERVKTFLKRTLRKSDKDEPPVFQHTCECALLSLALEISDQYIWQEYSKEEQDVIAGFLKSYGEAPTLSSNWQWFNTLILSFLYKRNYITEDTSILKHLDNIQAMYCGDGWFLDGGRLDYYNAWTFHFFGPLFIAYYGYKYWGNYAEIIEEQTNTFLSNYSHFFDGNGYMTMFGRSNIYRNAASAPFASSMFMNNCSFDPGNARWILASNLKQFVFDHDCFNNGVPSLGFYSEFLPCVQGYSSVASPLWMCFPFLVILLPEDHSFWTSRISRGIWDTDFNNYEILNIADNRLSIINYKATETVEISVNDLELPVKHHLLNQYSRLSFSSKFCWNDFIANRPPSMQFGFMRNGKMHIPSRITFGSFKDGVLCKNLMFGDVDCDISVKERRFEYGTIRTCSFQYDYSLPGDLLVGSYAVSSDKEDFYQEEIAVNGGKALILGDEKMQVAFVCYEGLSNLEIVKSNGTNPNRKYSAYVSAKVVDPTLFAFGIFFKYADDKWNTSDLKPFDILDVGE